MADTTRTFIAVAVPDALTLRLTRLQSQLAGEVPEGRWVETPPFHVTLAFLGAVHVADLNAVCHAARETAQAFPPLELKLDGLGAFPSPTRPRVVWTGLAGPGVEPLKALQAALASAVARLDYPTDGKPFHPHVTLGRLKPRRGPTRDLTSLLNHYRTWYAGPFTVAEVVTFSSTLTRDGPAYAPLERAPLKARKSTAPP
jgi:2'-5' RNA ligase